MSWRSRLLSSTTSLKSARMMWVLPGARHSSDACLPGGNTLPPRGVMNRPTWLFEPSGLRASGATGSVSRNGA
ncbi:MAG: hypothetical protein QOJ35_3419 [Solirubrobacteraceae bacterium]|nr:hypothetical protein [Solirubrobacteraceae bacterium]